MTIRHVSNTGIRTFVLIACCCFPVWALAQYNISILEDGPSLRSTALRELIKEEVLELTRDEFTVSFPAALQRHGNRKLPDIKELIRTTLNDPNVDLVVGLGPVVSHFLGRHSNPPKPTIAAIVVDADLQGLPFLDGSSGISNLSYLGSFKNTERDLQVFSSILPIKHLAILVDELIMQAIPELRIKGDEISKSMNIDLDIIPVGNSIDAALNLLPITVDSVYVTPLSRITNEQFSSLVEMLIERKLPSFSLLGKVEVDQGILAAAAPVADNQRTARRIAINIQRILLGEDAGDIKVAFSHGERLSVNMDTARRIGFSPNWRVLTEAELVNEEETGLDRIWDLESAMKEAVAANLDLKAKDHEVAAGAQDIVSANSVKRPQANIAIQERIIDQEHARASRGQNAERQLNASAGVTQLIYSDEANANIDIQQQVQRSRLEQREQLRLDLMLDSGQSYLNVLRAKALERIDKVNLRLTRSNLELARVRLRIGSANRSEVLRWESKIAGDRNAVIDASSQRRQAELNFNRVLHRPLEEHFATKDAGLDDQKLIPSRSGLFTYTSNPLAYSVFRDFMVQEGLDNSPELRALDASIAAQERTLESSKRSFWSPTINMEGSINEALRESGAGTGLLPLDDTSWELKLTAALSFFEGGRKRALNTQAIEQLNQLRVERRAAAERVATRIRTALQSAGAEFAGIDLARKAAASSKQNLELISDAYSRGAVSILDLLDAQNVALVAVQASANAEYDFLLEWMEVQRAVGRFDYFRSAQESDAWSDRLNAYFKDRGVSVEPQ